jgi:hypothetical protein
MQVVLRRTIYIYKRLCPRKKNPQQKKERAARAILSIKDFVREKKIRNRKKKEPQEQFFYEIEHQTS